MPHWPKKFLKHLDIVDLSRMEVLMKQLGNPHKKLPPAIHVAGTNGKGSTCAMLKSIFECAGKKTHVYTSPHILTFNERIVICGQKISDELLFECMEEVKEAYETLGMEPSFFEATTACAFVAFSKNPADVLILETGLGGRLDATNIVSNLLAIVITPISFDHMEYLGSTIRMIAREKAGIIKHGAKCIISMQSDEAMEVLLEVSTRNEVEAIAYEYDFVPEPQEKGFMFRSIFGDIMVDKIGLEGDHQIINASTVIAAIFSISDKVKIDVEYIRRGLARSEWVGRLQKASLAKFIGGEGKYCWLDGAHNPGGARVLNHWIRGQNFAKPVLIFGVTKNRDVVAFLSEFEGLYKIFSVPVLSEPSSYSSEKIAEIGRNAGINIEPHDTLISAVESAIQEGAAGQIIISGSLFLISDFLKI
ncbi:MAG: folylpolyglutamate synthase/dihydrofolate synthase family protein [Rickettsiaceae bacterium]|nr:folylpolyglutamate synthase/dihydrofolate synthase family protein [Rickettsiaceae bacterium]